MKIVNGRYSNAIVYTDLVEDSAIEQIRQLCDQPFADGCKIRIMPDVHSGAGCVIGFTADLGELVIPNIVGVDIGCGMLTVELGDIPVDYQKLDSVIHTRIPAGMNVHDRPLIEFPALDELICRDRLRNIDRIRNSLGTLGGGNHFIEIDCDSTGRKYLVIHTGSRNLGKQVAEIYQQIAEDMLATAEPFQEYREMLIESYKDTGKETELQDALHVFDQKVKAEAVPKELCYLSGIERDAYLHDMKICQDFAVQNRKTIADRILGAMFGKGLDDFEWFETIHNYIDHDSNIIRKGAVSAKAGEKLLIPINMRDGSLVCIGKGNEDWNCSAPHGAGRLFSRSAARKAFSVEEYRAQMDGIYTSSVSLETLDECPMAYKPMDAILQCITPTADVMTVIKPVYNFKAG